MNTNNNRPSNQSEDDNEHLYGMRKITFWEKYGVKRFPYRGRRRHTPILQQHFDGRISISNDVFGLTIHQFEQKYIACLERRKQNSQRILNLRYPVKSSNKYLEYLEHCAEHGEGYMSRSGNDFHAEYLYSQLVQIVGKEPDIRYRQRLFLIEDVIRNIIRPSFKRFVSGSLSEGLDLPGSDIDIMYVLPMVEAVSDTQNIKHITTLLMEIDPFILGLHD
ncbi:unnamed protein product [Mytilus coruscus]|uniref:Uncharacterized protein n=1 Tax=Mytilus coruscus TaxID=42192 RepID=A0A6J8C232_MYTCO|nr:unnamed protein product [Mytilus coruscus]